MTSKRRSIALLGLAAAAAFSSVAHADTVAVQLGNQTGTSNTSDWAAGFAFTVTTALNVTHLGKFDQEANGIVGSLLSPHPVYTGTVLTGDTAPFWRDPANSPNSTNHPHHWNFNGESDFLFGKALGDNMVNLLGP